MDKNKKMDRTSIKIIFATFISILLATALYGFFVPVIMCYPDEIRGVFHHKLIMNILLIAPIATFIVYLIYKPAERLILRIKSGEEFNGKDFDKAVKAVESIPPFLFVIGTVSYVIGVALNYIPVYIRTGSINMEDMILRLIIGLVWGVLNGVITARILNFYLVEAKLKFKLYSFDNFHIKKQSILFKLLMPLSFLFMFFTAISMVIVYNYSKFVAGSVSQGGDITVVIFQVVSKLGFVYLMLLLFVIVLIYIVIIESMTYIKNLSNQLNGLLLDEVDMSSKIRIVNFDDIGIISDKINKVINRLAQTFIQIKNLGDGVYKTNEVTKIEVGESHSATIELNKTVDKIERDLEKQLVQMDQMFGEFNEMILFSDNTAENNKNQLKFIGDTSNSIKSMIESFEKLIGTSLSLDTTFKGFLDLLRKNKDDLVKADQSIKDIDSTAVQVNDIAGIISDIAAKTNLLSMNASIEAAHAGSHGAGFNVVASEIRKLSSNTAVSARNITNLINTMNDKIGAGQNLFKTLLKNFESMIIESDQLNSVIAGISSSSSEQIAVANNNLEKIAILIKGTEEIKKNTSLQQQKFSHIKEAIVKLNDNTNNMVRDEKILTKEIKDIIEHLDSIKERFDESTISIESLKETISKYKY